MKEIHHCIQLSIIQILSEPYIPTPLPYPLPCHRKSTEESHSNKLIPTPIVMLESHSIPHPNLKLSILAESLPTHSNTSPKTATMYTPTQLRSSFPPHFPKLLATTLLQCHVSTPKHHSIFPTRLY